jgi:CheY-like chemotaxis protein
MDKTILVIEDEPFTVERLVEHLRDHSGYYVEVVAGVEPAIERLTVRKFDVIVLDIMMAHQGTIGDVPPKRTGIYFVKALRSGTIAGRDVSANAKVPIVVLTGVSGPNDIAAIRDMQGAELLRKPAGCEQLVAAIQRAIEMQ